jgi:uncharacterized protein (TIGR02001 family)
LIKPLALLLPIVLCPQAAQAQWSGSVGVMSDYLYRGVSLSDGRAAPRLGVNYDGAAGWYAGGQVIGGQLGPGHRSAQWLGYAGYAQRLASGASWEAGVSRYAFPQWPSWHFNEVHVGVAIDKLSARFYYSPDYLGLGTRTLYSELNGGTALGTTLTGFWHLGYLGSVHARPGAAIARFDARLGVQASVADWRLELALDMAHKRRSNTIYYAGDWRTRRDIVLSLGYAF